MIDFDNMMSTAYICRGMNISDCESFWTFRSCPNYAFVSEHSAIKKMCFGYLRVLCFKWLCFCDC